MTFEPPRYEWTATNAAEATAALHAATDLLAAHMNTMAPNEGHLTRVRAEVFTPLTITLDLTALVQEINKGGAGSEKG